MISVDTYSARECKRFRVIHVHSSPVRRKSKRPRRKIDRLRSAGGFHRSSQAVDDSRAKEYRLSICTEGQY